MTLKNFKGFAQYSIPFQNVNLLVGPNSAGKSSILTALRLADQCIRIARLNRPTVPRHHNGSSVLAYNLPLRNFEILNESVRHNFRNAESSIELRWKNGCRLVVVWPEQADLGDRIEPFFYAKNSDGQIIKTAREAKLSFNNMGIVPTLSPVEQEEKLLDPEYVRKNYPTRLSSRHFRNQLHLTSTEGSWDSFIEFSTPWLADLSIGKPVVQYSGEGGAYLDVLFTESGSRFEKELAWAGDGIQIWVQLLMQIYRLRLSETLVLDEPEVFLHPDLQRRLIRLLDVLGRQIVLATHSSEVLAESERDAIVWVDKSKTRGIRSPRGELLGALDATLGTAFNLGLARALRSRAVLFVEGKDIRVLKILANRLGYENIVIDTKLAVVPLNGYSNWTSVEPFRWFIDNFLQSTVSTMVLLDRDYRTPAQIQDVEKKISAIGITAHVWQRKELESYLIIPSVIARLSGATTDSVEEYLDKATASMESDVCARFMAEKHRSEVSASKHYVELAAEILDEFKTAWQGVGYRRSVCPPKEILSAINAALQKDGKKAVSFEAIAKYTTASEISGEMANVLRKIDQLGS